MKNARLDVRLAPEHKKLIEEAARLSGATTSAFMQMTLPERARAVVREHQAVERVVLPSATFDRLWRELDGRPAKVVPELLTQLRKTRS